MRSAKARAASTKVTSSNTSACSGRVRRAVDADLAGWASNSAMLGGGIVRFQ
jgi:hypothetical protein